VQESDFSWASIRDNEKEQYPKRATCSCLVSWMRFRLDRMVHDLYMSLCLVAELGQLIQDEVVHISGIIPLDAISSHWRKKAGPLHPTSINNLNHLLPPFMFY
jgi:hypothetical protein